MGRQRRRPGGPGRASAACGHGRRRGRGRPDRQIRRQAGRHADARLDRREPAARHGRDHCDLRRVAAARRRAGATGRARQVDRSDGQEGPEGAQGRARGGDGQVRARPHRPADPRPELRRHDRQDDRQVGPGLDDHSGAEGARERAERPPHPHRRRGVRPAGHLRRARRDSQSDARRADGPLLQPLPRRRALLADQGRDAHRAKPAPRGHGLGRRVPGAVPRLHRRRAEELCRGSAHPQGERLRDRRVRQVAHDARSRAGRRGPVRALAAELGLQPLLGLSQRRRGSVGSASHAGQHEHRRAGGLGRQAVLLPGRPDRQVRRVAARRPRAGRREAVVSVLLDRLRPRAAPRGEGVGRQVQGQVRPGLGQAPRGGLRAAEEARGHSRKMRS